MSYSRRTRIRERHLVKGESAVYHVVNRAALGSMILNDACKEQFVKMMRKQAGFCGVEVLAYCVMTNHFHILVRVPEPHEISDEELLRRYRILYGKHCPESAPTPEVLKDLLALGDDEAQEWRKRIMDRMHNLSAFVGELKHRFSIWYNDHRQNRGTVWSERFRSIIVEDQPEFTAPVAAYIDLNPVRAEIVEDPAEYAFSGYGAVMNGGRSAQYGIRSLYLKERSWKQALESYRVLIFGKGYTSKGNPDKDKGMIDPDRAYQVIQDGGKLSWAEYLRMRIGYFTRGGVLGSSEYIKSVDDRKADAGAPARKAHLLTGINETMRSLRNLQVEPIG